MKKQILSILLMIVAIAIACGGLLLKKSGDMINAGIEQSKNTTDSEITANIAAPVSPQFSQVPAPQTTAEPVSQPTAEPTNQPTAAPTPQSTATTTPQSAAETVPQSTAETAPQSTAAPTPQSTATTAPQSTVATTPEPTATPAPQIQVTNAYSPDTIDSLTSIGLAVEDINSMADMGITESEIADVISVVNITPEMIAEFDKYKDIWASASALEKKLMIELLKQVAGK